jgi:hypothetical protein
MKTKFLMLALIAILFSACSVDQDETNFENANVELSESNEFTEANSDDSRNGFSSRNSLSACRDRGGMSIPIVYVTGNGTTPLEVWKEQVRARFISYGFVRESVVSETQERWDFLLDNMTPEKAALSPNGCRNDVVREAINDDDDVAIDLEQGCEICGFN